MRGEMLIRRKYELKISNKQNSNELIKLPLKIIKSVVFKYL